MKIRITTCALPAFLCLATLSTAQETQTGMGRSGMTLEARVKFMKEQLKLSDEQTEKVTAVLGKSQDKVRALRDDASLSDDARRAKMREIFTASAEEVKPILTPEQQAQWHEQVTKRREQMEAQAAGEKKAEPTK